MYVVRWAGVNLSPPRRLLAIVDVVQIGRRFFCPVPASTCSAPASMCPASALSINLYLMTNANHSHCGCGGSAVDAAVAAAIVRGHTAEPPASVEPTSECGCGGHGGCGCGGDGACGCGGGTGERPVVDERIVDLSEGRRDLGLRGLPA
ncbi:hypothetical protein HMPREF0972_02254 [Actinomyces sp. oral taxon 848 str. F0332]|nr:hypothetical protein HMPREF0972_02254 [Actinomyces sp. oral taxon 848 str. F0332]